MTAGARYREGAAGAPPPERPAYAGVDVLPMRRWHLQGVLAIEQLVYPRPWSASLFVSELSRTQDRRYLVARDLAAPRWRRAAVLGYAGVVVQGGEAHVTTVAVHPHEHRRKIGTRLVAAVMRSAIALGADAATLEVRTANLGAQRLYQAFGFTSVGVRAGYYSETGEDALIMWAYEIQSPRYEAVLAAQERRVAEPGGASGTPDLAVPWARERVGLPGPGPSREST